MNKKLLIGIALAAVLTGCIKDEEAIFQDKMEMRRQPKDSVWTVCIEAFKEIPVQAGNDGLVTKGLEIGEGGLDNTTVLRSIWKQDDPVLVYLGTECIGTLKANPDATDAHKATLSGTVTTTGITANSTKLTLLTPRQSWDYTRQVGLLRLADDPNNQGDGNRSIEKKYHYTMAENVLVTSAEGGAITTEKASFKNQQSIYRMNFRFQKGSETPSAINAKRIWITAADGGLVQSRGLDGSSVTGTIDVILDAATANPFFVALRNNNTTAAEDLKFKVMDNEGVTYYGTKTIPAQYKPDGTFVSMKNATLTGRLELSLISETVATAL